MKKLLSVPFHRQSFGYSCFPASVKKVLGYYGDSVSERTLYQKSQLPGFNGTFDVKIGPFLMKKGYDFIVFWNGSTKKWNISPKTRKAYDNAYQKAIRLVCRTRETPAFS